MTMKTRFIIFAYFVIFLALIGSVQANSVFVIEPSKEVIQNVQTDWCKSIGGNVSVDGGNIDFYVTDPSGTTLLRYENISFINFKFNTTQNGTYIIHLANRCSANNVTATLFYGRNFEVTVSETIRMWHTIATTTMTLTTPFTNPWVEPLVQIALIVFASLICPLLVNILSDEIRRRIQKWRDGEPKTPSDFSSVKKVISIKVNKLILFLRSLYLDKK